ncbi:MerR family transcriptional regulator [Haloimpatiens sp. FM7330]|uniref:MerR family transcriptional regulator n=1 Tax=Haloimpatiens sp. FM7330 TaxID=3298610 RepID=UPI00363E74AE
MKSRLSIGQMSKLHNVSIHTLRYYDKIGLLKPSKVDVNSNYRYYDDYDSDRLEKIKGFKVIGIPLNKIKFLLDGDIEEVEQLFYHMRKESLDKINKLKEIVYYLDEQLKYIEEFKRGNCYIEPKIITLSKREGYIIEVSESSNLVERIEAIVNFDKKNSTNADVFFKPSRLINIKSNGKRCLQNYLALKRGTACGDSKNLYILEAGKYAVIDHIGQGKYINKSYDKLLKYIESKGMSIEEQAIEILVINPSLTNNPEEWRTQIQIKVK